MKNIKSVFTSYTKVIDSIGEERIEERLEAIKKIYSFFLKEAECIDDDDIFLNTRVLMHVILDYFTDITRLKEFHKIEKINKDKIIAYEICWFIRRKPIQILKDNKEELIYVNEKFALELLVNHLTNGEIDELSENKSLRIFCEVLLYYMKYRNCDAKVIEMLIMSFKAGNSIDKIEYEN